MIVSLGNRLREMAGRLRALLFPAPVVIKIEPTPQEIIDGFHKLYYNAGLFNGKTWEDTYWLGVQVKKCPLDLWIYQELMAEVRPDVVVESGTARGGGALFMASMCDLLGNGRVITIDIEQDQGRPTHPRLTYLLGSSTSPEIVAQVRALIRETDSVLVILDSDHNKEHVLRELEIYSAFVTPGSYIIVEDTNIHGHPVLPEFPAGPMEAVEEFVARDKTFTIDRTREKFLLTLHPKGFLRRTG